MYGNLFLGMDGVVRSTTFTQKRYNLEHQFALKHKFTEASSIISRLDPKTTSKKNKEERSCAVILNKRTNRAIGNFQVSFLPKYWIQWIYMRSNNDFTNPR